MFYISSISICISIICYEIISIIKNIFIPHRFYVLKDYRKTFTKLLFVQDLGLDKEKEAIKFIQGIFHVLTYKKDNKIYLGTVRENLKIKNLFFLSETEEFLYCYVEMCFDLYQHRKITRFKKNVQQSFLIAFLKNDNHIVSMEAILDVTDKFLTN